MQADGFTLVIVPTWVAMPQPIGGFVQIAGDNIGGAARRQIADASERGSDCGAVNHLMQCGGGRINVKEALSHRVDGSSWAARSRRGNWAARFSRAAGSSWAARFSWAARSWRGNWRMQAQDLAVNIISTWAAVPRLVLGSVGIAGGFVSRVVIRAFTSTHGATRRPLKIRMQCGGHNINVRALGVDRGRGIAIGHGRGVGGGVRFRGDEGLREFGIILGNLGPLPALASQEEGWHSRLGLRLPHAQGYHHD